MKGLSLQWRITIMTALLTCAACVLTNCLVGYTGMRYMDAIGSGISAFNATGEDLLQAFDPTKAALDDKVTIVVNDAQESFRHDSLVHHGWSHTPWRRAGILCERRVHLNRYGLLQLRLSVCSLTT